jgi:hypothetical protein
MVTDEQVRLSRQKRMDGKSQEAAAAAAGMGVRSLFDTSFHQVDGRRSHLI